LGQCRNSCNRGSQGCSTNITTAIIIIIIITTTTTTTTTIIIKLAQEIKNVGSKEDTDMTGYPISNRISAIHTYTTVKHNGNRTSNQGYTKCCHVRHIPYN
jgi:hypothetical protein